MDNFQNPYLLNVLSQSMPEPSARLGNPSSVSVTVGMAGGVTPEFYNNSNDIAADLLRQAPAALTGAGWGVAAFTSAFDPDTGNAGLGFTLNWSCANGGGPDIQQNVKDGLTEVMQSIGFVVSNIDLDTSAINACGLVFSTQPTPTPTPTNTNPAGGGSAISNLPPAIGTGAKATQSWFDKNFFTGAGTLSGVGIGAALLIGVVLLSKQK